VPIEEFTNPDGQLAVNVGDTVEVVIRTIHTGDAPPLLSRADKRSIERLGPRSKRLTREERPIVGKIIDKTKGGLRVISRHRSLPARLADRFASDTHP
jgi:ribosomal protein S1